MSTIRLIITCFQQNMFPLRTTTLDTLSQHTLSNVPVTVSCQLLKDPVLVGTSHGLFCLSSYYRDDIGYLKQRAVIWNPSLGKSVAIDVTRHTSVLGFGVRPDNCDPMIVMINHVKHSNEVMLTVTVFTLSSRVWRVPRGGNLPSESIIFNNGSIVAAEDWRIYWKAYERERELNLVVAFDMVSEDFTEIHLPHSIAQGDVDDFSISKIKESLALLDYSDDAEEQVCNVWMMVEDGVSKSFRKLFTINTLDASFIQVLGFRKNNEPIIETETNEYGISKLEAYEPRTRAVKNLGINGVEDSFFCCSYTETLILLDQLDGSNL